MAFVSVPKDLTKVKNKIILNLTKRQLICLGIAAAVGLPFYFLTRGLIGSSNAATGMCLLMLPAFLFAMYEKDGQPLEVVAKHFYEAKFKRPKTRPYKTKNYYALLVQQADAEMEVNRIVQNGKKQERQSGAGISNTAAMTRQRSFLRRVWRRSCC